MAVPKVELHCHLEGAAGPALIRQLAKRNNTTLPETLFTPDDRFAWDDFQGFLSTYDDASQAIRTTRDYRDVTYEYLTECSNEGAIYVEVMSSPDHAAAAGMSYDAHLEGIVQGIDDAQRDCGIIGRLIVTCVRHFGPAQAMKVADQVCGSPHPYVVGFGMGGNEMVHKFKDFQPAFDRVHMAGLPCTVHAGEWVGAASVNEALETLPIQRIGHGVRAVEDKHILERLVRESVHLEVCPTSNVMTGIYPDYDFHPFNILRDEGIRVSLNSDDPPYFATTIGREYEIAGSRLGLDDRDLVQISEDAVTAAFVDEENRSILLERIRRN
mgnify:CR=1 FL=1